jgi:hypothetical protein
MAVTGERLVTGGNGRNISGQEGWIGSGYRSFGPVIIFGSASISESSPSAPLLPYILEKNLDRVLAFPIKIIITDQ